MEWKDVGNAVKNFAPLLGTVLGGPAAGGAVALLCNALGTDNQAEPDQVLKAISADPQAALKLRKIESDNQVELQRLVLAAEQAYLADRQDARRREVDLARATGGRDINLYVLAWTVVVGFFGLVALLMFVALPSGAAGYINQLFGAMAAGFGMVLSYFFGTNKSSSEKTRMLAQKTNGQA